jgi:hypothetical protein
MHCYLVKTYEDEPGFLISSGGVGGEVLRCL